MDIVSHAAAGAAAGYALGHPVAGALWGVLPDLVLGYKRLAAPPVAYNVTHSLLFVLLVGVTTWAIGAGWVAALALFSHILLDLPTHGKLWAPTLFYPFSKTRYSIGPEWEWFNATWWKGFAITLTWIFLCVQLSEYLTGFQS